ncbi:MAG: hypothetical protein EXQ53_00600 [Acidobacteria bacterium]|nr:hypothetical protein [Acidobacteriota bacterium]
MKAAVLGLAAAVALVGAAPAVAHHSYAAFDRDTRVTLTGVVKELQWNNPHAWIQIMVVDEKGRQTEWGVECGSPNMMARTGWKRSTLTAGDKVVVVVNPLKDGRPNGALVTITLPDGRVLGPGNAPGPRPLGSAAKSKS